MNHAQGRADLLDRLDWPSGPVDIVLDTDTAAEVDDPFALAYAALSTPRVQLRAVTAAPFTYDHAPTPGRGVRQSRDEAKRILALLDMPTSPRVCLGSERWLESPNDSVPSEARDTLVELLESRGDQSLYVVCIAAATNVASVLNHRPDLAAKMVVLWLGGHPLHWPRTDEFNLKGDAHAARTLLDSGAPLILFPCRLVAEMLHATLAELETHLRGASPVADALVDLVRDFVHEPMTTPGVSKPIWDLAPLAWLINPDWVTTSIQPSPVLTPELTWRRDPGRHPIRVAEHIDRSGVFVDLFRKLYGHRPPQPARPSPPGS